jgi:hypothetical protein
LTTGLRHGQRSRYLSPLYPKVKRIIRQYQRRHRLLVPFTTEMLDRDLDFFIHTLTLVFDPITWEKLERALRGLRRLGALRRLRKGERMALDPLGDSPPRDTYRENWASPDDNVRFSAGHKHRDDVPQLRLHIGNVQKLYEREEENPRGLDYVRAVFAHLTEAASLGLAAIRWTRVDIAYDVVVPYRDLGVDWSTSIKRHDGSYSSRVKGGELEHGYYTRLGGRRPALIAYSKALDTTRIERRLYSSRSKWDEEPKGYEDMTLGDLKSVDPHWERLTVYDLASATWSHPGIRKAIDECANDVRLLGKKHPELARLARVWRDPCHPRRLFVDQQEEMVRQLCRRLGISSSRLGVAAIPWKERARAKRGIG